MIKQKHILFLLFALLVVYFAYKAYTLESTIISKGSMFLYIFISGVYFIKTLLLRNRKDPFYIVWTALFVLNLFGYIFTGNYANNFTMFAGMLMSLLTFYPFYYFSQKDILKSKHLISFFLIMLPIAIASFLFEKENIIIQKALSHEEIINNNAYFFVNLIPFVFLFRKKRVLSLIAMLVLMFFIIQGAKRGAIIAGFVGLLILIFYQLQTIDAKHKTKGYLLSFIGIGVLSYFTYKVYVSNEFLINRMQDLAESGGSGRDVIYFNILEGWYNSNNLFNQLFGFGFAGSKKLTGGMGAHNDWLELLSNFGLLGVLIYLVLFYSSYKLIRNSNWGEIDKRLIMLAVVSIWFMITLYSMGYTDSFGYLRAIMLGYLLGSKHKSIA